MGCAEEVYMRKCDGRQASKADSEEACLEQQEGWYLMILQEMRANQELMVLGCQVRHLTEEHQLGGLV